MNRIYPHLKRDYERWLKKLGKDYVDAPGGIISMQDVLRAHYLLCDYFIREGEDIALAGPRNATLLPSAVGRQCIGYGGIRKWENEVEICATLFYGLIKDHPFHDGNKRTAFLVAVYHLFINNRILSTKHRPWEELAIHTAAGTLNQYPQYSKFRKQKDADVLFIADFFRRHTRRSDKRDYIITFNQLQSILKRFGYDLDNPAGNFIDVVRIEKKRGFLGKKTISHKITHIGFPGWTKEVAKKDIQKVRKKAKLTPEKDIDSQVFYKGEDSMAALIPRYHRVLIRLKDK